MKFSAAAAIAFAFLPILAASPALGQVLTHGPVVGGVTAATANVFVRTNQAATVALCYGTDPNLDTCQISDTYQTNSVNDFTKIIPLSSLPAHATFYINVVVNGVPQFDAPPYPSFTTFPPSGTSRNFSFVVLSDFKNTGLLTKTVQTFVSAAAEHPVFAFIGGDFDHREPRDLSAKRKMYKDLYDANTPYMSDFVPLILQRTPIIHQWDDHDSGGNNLDKTYPTWNLNQQVFEEYMPSYRLPSVTPGIWQKFSYAQAECFVLDCRSQRDPETDFDGPEKSMLDGNDLDATGQLRWLKHGLVTSTARWKIIFTSVIINPTTKFPDGWAGYQTEWNGLKNFINKNNIQGVVFISGDLHLGAIDNGLQAGFPEMCVATPNLEVQTRCSTAPPGTWSEGFYDDTCTGYGLVTILKNPDRLILQVADQYGNVHISYTVRQQRQLGNQALGNPPRLWIQGSGTGAKDAPTRSDDRETAEAN
jgi:alkaline phosphatase D